jgi:RNA polymerase sigma-70 factor (ECF subfamily)
MDERPLGLTILPAAGFFSLTDVSKTRISLILRLQRPSDAEAWQQFCEIYQPLVFRIARSRGLQNADADDLTQEVLVRVAKSVGRWQPEADRGSFRGWISTIARNLVIDFLRKQSAGCPVTQHSDVHRLLAEIPEGGSVDDHAKATQYFDAEHERQMFFWAANKIKSSFQDRTWQVFWETTVNERPVSDVSRELEMSRGAIYVARSRVIARLRKTIESASVDCATHSEPAVDRSAGR